jgi:hypothetical protein
VDEAPVAAEWFSRVRAPGSTAASATEFIDTEFGGTQFGAATAAGSRPGLPRRARGTNLAPQLRAKLSAAPAHGGREGPDSSGWLGASAAEPPLLSPEEASGMLSALQDGWERARIEDLDYSDGEEHR